jgi:putative ABC transport system permease protein
MDETMQPEAIVFASSLSADPPFYRKALVKAKTIDVVEQLRDRFINEGFLVSARIDLVNQAKKITNVITTVLGVFGITALVVSAIGMFNTMIVGFMERTYEVGILKSIGATDGDVRNLFLMEAMIMGLLGGVGGIIIGMFAGRGLNILLNIWAKSSGGKGFELFLTPWWFILLILVLSLFIGLISGMWPAYRATKLSPKEAFTRR